MAHIACVLGVTHNPFMPRLLAQPEPPSGALAVKARLDEMRDRLSDARPDALIMIGNDHLNQFFMDNMPAFLVGKMDSYPGTFPNESREFGIATCRVPGEPELSDLLLDGGFDRGIDFAYSNELRIDHSIVVPLLWLRPDMDVPIVPVLTNCIAPPLPRAQRFYEVGQAIRATIEHSAGDRRIAVVVSGHLSLEVGGPRQFEARLLDPEFDDRAVGWVATGDIDGAARACRFPDLHVSGNMTYGFLNFLLAMGVARGRPPTHAEAMDVGFPAVPFFAWDAQPETTR